MIRIICCCFILLAPPLALAEEYTCQAGELVRKISVVYAQKGKPTPCRVRYEKLATNRVEYPWNARVQAGYCEEKATYLADRLESLGWECTQTDAGRRRFRRR